MKFRILAVAVSAIFAMSTSAFAALISVPLTADVANSSGNAHGGSLPVTLTDPFAYDPANPTSALPSQNYNGSTHYHGNGGNPHPTPTLFYTLAPTTFTAGSTLDFDFYGRADCCQDRDNNYDIALLSGGAGGSVVGEVLGNNNPDPAPRHLRTDLASVLTDGDMFDTIRITGNNGNFTIAEVRLAADLADPAPVPEPASIAIWSLLGLCLAGYGYRRHRRNS